MGGRAFERSVSVSVSVSVDGRAGGQSDRRAVGRWTGDLV